MSDIKRSLQSWIERSAAPVTAEEAIRRASDDTRERPGPRRPWTAAVAGAALILLVVGLPSLLLRPEGETGPATSPTASVATVPNWVGRSIDDVRAEADSLGINLVEEQIILDDGTPGMVIRQSPEVGLPIPTDNTVVVGVAATPDEQATTTTVAVGTPCALPEIQPKAGERYITVFYGCRSSFEEQVQPLPRAIPAATPSLIETAFRGLLAGPANEEREAGIESGYGSDTTGLVASVSFDSGDLRVDLAPEIVDITLQDRDITALFATGFQFETTGRVEVTVAGSCDSFSQWAGRECSLDADAWWHEGQARELIAGWPRVVARPALVSGDCNLAPAEPGPGEMQITLLYSCRSGEDSLLELTLVTREVPAGSDAIMATLDELVKGPNGEELAAGVDGSFLSERTALMVRAATLDGSRLIVDFHPFARSPEISNIGTSTGGLVFNTVLNANLFQFPEVEEIEYRVDGSCDAYWASFEAGCSIQTREGHEWALSELS